ncbi:unnamed protein product [Prunus brigantina]
MPFAKRVEILKLKACFQLNNCSLHSFYTLQEQTDQPHVFPAQIMQLASFIQ